MDFPSFLAPFDAEAFRTGYFGSKPLFISREGGRGPSLLSWQRFNEVLAITPFWNEDTLKVFFKNRGALRENYCDTADLRAGERAPVNPAKVKALMGLGASLVANHVHRVCPEVGAVAHMLEQTFAARVAANVYCSFRGVQAFQTHFDLHDVFAVQAEGEKTWRVYESRADNPTQTLPPGDEIEKWLVESRGKVLFEVTMKPGDILYLPRGQYHDALTGAQASLHVTFGVSPATGLALFKLLETAVTQESAFRAYLPDARNEAALAARLVSLADRIRTVLTSPSFAIDVLNHQRDLARLPADYALPAQAQATWYSVTRRAHVARRDKGFAVVYDGGEIPVGASYPTLEWMLRQRLFSLDDAAARQASVDRAELQRDIALLERAGILALTEMKH
ncbi:MAG: cupin domain-containing protein [Gammaproteobacteria bacterium]|nr:cupin domain-containing protein [Gammaproteobacteria bacterium]